MEINYLNEFVKLAETGNYLEAADALYISQSTLSRHIQNIENDLGVQLFNRTTRKVELNEFGRTFLPFAKQITGLKADYTQAMTNQIRRQKNSITIGAIPTMTQYYISEILARFQNENPSIHLNIIGADSSKLDGLLRDGECDFAFMRSSGKTDQEFQSYPYFTDHMVAVVSRNHPLASSGNLSLSQLKAEPFLFLAKDSTMYTFALNACLAAGFTPHIRFTGHRAENIVDLAGREMGIGLLSKQPVMHLDTSSVCLIDIVPQFTTKIVLMFKSEQSLTPTARQFLKFYKSLGIN
ncbi:MAG: LysR family transcriptional regulator [Clostridiales bacterium]|nr:LysR family transcriptional regulator [Clostridiales bacterium]